MLLVSVGLRFLYSTADSSQSFGLAIVSSSGARYYLQDGQWHPITNRTSARLLGDSSTGTMKISTSDLSKYSQGQALGIPDAPEDVPSSADHMTADWTSCAISEHTFTWIGNSSLLSSNGLHSARSAHVTPLREFRLLHRRRIIQVPYPRQRQRPSSRACASAPPPSPWSPNWVSLFDDGPDLTTWGVAEPGGAMASSPPEQRLTAPGQRHRREGYG